MRKNEAYTLYRFSSIIAVVLELCEMFTFCELCYMKQNRKSPETLENAQYGLEIIFKYLLICSLLDCKSGFNFSFVSFLARGNQTREKTNALQSV